MGQGIWCAACEAESNGTNATILRTDSSAPEGKSDSSDVQVGVVCQFTGYYKRPDGTMIQERWSFELCPKHYLAGRTAMLGA